MTYEMIRRAIVEKRSLSAMYQGRMRHFSPHALGRSASGKVNVLALQYDGESSTPLPMGGQWRCFEVNLLESLVVNQDAFSSAPDKGGQSKCVIDVDVSAQ